MPEIPVTAFQLAPHSEGSPRVHRRLAARLSRLLRRSGRGRREIRMPLRDVPITAGQLLAWGRTWCLSYGARYYVLLRNGTVVGMMTEKADGKPSLTWLTGPRYSL